MEWRKGPETLRAGDRVSLNQEGAVCELEIRGLTVEDTGEYSCVCGQERTSATLTIKGKGRQRPQGPVASCLRVVCVTGSTAGFCGFSYIFTWVPADVSWLRAPRSVGVNVQ